MSNALLLRLFTSEFFNSWIAISYLFRYPDNVGIQHYLCNELKKFPNEEIEFFLPQLIHLLITRPSDSVALEYFLLEKFEQSSHIAVMSLWYFHAYLSDLSMTPNSPSFKLANRVSNKCQAIVFSDGSVGEEIETALGIPARRIRDNIFPAVVGIGMMFAGIGQPLLTKQAGQIAIAQGRRNRALSTAHLNTQTLTRRKTVSGASVSTTDKADDDGQTKDGDERNSSTGSSEDMLTSLQSPLAISISPLNSSSQPNLVLPNRRSLNSHRSSTVPNSPSLDEISKGSKVFSVNRFIANGKSKQRPVSANFDTEGGAVVALPSDNLTLHHPPLPLTPSSTATSESESEASGVQTPQTPQTPKTPKSPKSPRSLSHSHRHHPEALSTTITTRPHRSLLKSTYFKSEMQFLLTLVDIATRLVIVPKTARQSSLQAELTLLNHNLPAEVCIPMWCPGTGTTRADPYRTGHHRVVRISPTDAVVLNSAERAPYLVLIEVLEGEVGEENGFDETVVLVPERRENGERETEQLIKESEALIKMRDMEGGLQIKLEVAKETEEDKKTKEVGILEAYSIDGSSALMTEQIVEKSDMSSQIADATLTKSTLISDPTFDVIVNDNTSAIGPIPQISISTPVNQSQPIPSPSISTTSSQPTPTVRRPSRSADEFAEQMRTAAIMLAQLQQQAKTVPATSGKQAAMQRQKTEEIRQRIIREMMALEETRMLKMKMEGVGSGVGGSGGEGAGGEMLEDEKRLVGFVDREDPSAAVFKENWEEKKNRIRAFSPYGHLPNWKLISVIVKNGGDLRQEQLACQLIREIQRIWERAKLDLWLRYYRLLVTSESSGLIETIINSISIHSIKKDAYARRLNEKGVVYTLYDHFIRAYGEPTSPSFLKAQDNFMRSLAGYSIVCYVLNIKDRHNGNVLLGNDGHLIHIDYGFILSNSPGSVGFEMAPFKLPQEYLDVLGGINGEKFAEFKALMKTGFLVLRKNCENIVLLVEMMQKDSKLPCFLGGEATIAQLRDRFQLALTESQAEEYVDKLILSSACSIFTRLYDTFQYYSQGIL